MNVNLNRDVRTLTFVATPVTKPSDGISLGVLQLMTGKIKCDTYKLTHTRVLFTIKKNKIMSSAGKWIKLDTIMLSKISQVQKDKGHMFSLICGIQDSNICTHIHIGR
jgi:hypothetical protein